MLNLVYIYFGSNHSAPASLLKVVIGELVLASGQTKAKDKMQ